MNSDAKAGIGPEGGTGEGGGAGGKGEGEEFHNGSWLSSPMRRLPAACYSTFPLAETHRPQRAMSNTTGTSPSSSPRRPKTAGTPGCRVSDVLMTVLLPLVHCTLR